MSISLPLLKGFISVGGTAAVAGSSYVVYQHSDSIKTFFTRGASNTQPQEDTQEYVYFVVKNTTATSSTETSLYDAAKKTKQFTCQFTKADGTKVTNPDCKIYNLSASNAQKTLINVKDTFSTSASTEIQDKSSLTLNDQYLLKLPKTFVETLPDNTKAEIEVVDKNANENNVIATFIKVLDLSKTKQTVTKTVGQSNLFSVLITTASATTSFDANDTYKCTIGTTTDLPCKVYQLDSTYLSSTKAQLDASAKKLTSKDELAIGKYALVELTETQKTLTELDGQVIILKTTDATQVAQGLAEQLFVGSVNGSTPSNNNLYIVSDSYPSVTAGTVTTTDKAYILTKGSSAFTLPEPTAYTATDYLCRVISENKKYDDEDCKLYSFPKANATHFELSDYKTSTSPNPTAITALTDLAAAKHQVIELKKELQTQLKKDGASLHLVQKARKDKTINNKLITFTKEFNISENSEETVNLKANLFLVRYKGNKPNSNKTLEASTSLTCSIDGGSDLPCKIYKFTETPKTSNNVTNAEVTALTSVTSTDTSFTDHSYLAIELLNHSKSSAELHNKVFTLKAGSEIIGTFDFDQVIIGKAATYGLPIKPLLETYIVKKPTTWTSATGATSFSCKFTNKTTSKVNYDAGCKLEKITTATNDTIQSFSNTKAGGTALTTTNISSDTNNYYRLTVNANLLNNLAFDENVSSEVQVELINNSNASMGFVDIKQKLVDNKFIGKTKLLLGKVSENTSNATGQLESAKCNLDPVATASVGNQFGCSLFAATSATASKAAKELVFETTAAATSDATTFTKDKYYLIKLTEDKKISDFDQKTNILYQIPGASGSTTFTNVELKIIALMSGEIEANNNAMFITEPATA